jgi:hypothetical protein
MTTQCQGCGKELRDVHPNTKWCSEACRRYTKYGGTCVDCGGKTSGSKGIGDSPKHCASCVRSATLTIDEKRKANTERCRRYRSKRPDIARREVARYQDRHPERRAVWLAVGAAIKAGALIKPSVCESCGEKAEHLHAHHEDYSKPLDVEWACPLCHCAKHLSACL